MAEQQSYEFVEVKAADIMAERTALWGGFTRFVTISTVAIIVALVLIYLLWG
ncbi:preprotein translocase subunit SecE [Neoroseomonas rubea]|uniref:preprotein translocase subunit SecE n=1 Tax=Neoroseomonas rubea TaxID=2748666 RepID=UPI0018E05937|nr:preprotein translocase subunit SecE [Roseomonas rubea]